MTAWRRSTLGILLLALAVNALAGGVYGLAGARGVPRSWLDGSPFDSYLVPSLILFVVVGGGCLVAGIEVLRARPHAALAARSAGLMLLAWIAAQVAIIGYVSWLQPAVALAGALIVTLASLPAPRGASLSRSERTTP
jgi:hypothetical protein